VSALAATLAGVFVFMGTASPVEALFAPAYAYIRGTSAPPGARFANIYPYVYEFRAAIARRGGATGRMRICQSFSRNRKAHRRDLEDTGTRFRFERHQTNLRVTHRAAHFTAICKITCRTHSNS
jgi:hypothetical protein